MSPTGPAALASELLPPPAPSTPAAASSPATALLAALWIALPRAAFSMLPAAMVAALGAARAPEAASAAPLTAPPAPLAPPARGAPPPAPPLAAPNAPPPRQPGGPRDHAAERTQIAVAERLQPAPQRAGLRHQILHWAERLVDLALH